MPAEAAVMQAQFDYLKQENELLREQVTLMRTFTVRSVKA